MKMTKTATRPGKGGPRIAPVVVLFIGCLVTQSAHAQLELLPDPAPQRVFSGDARRFPLLWRNRGQKTAEIDLHARLHQTSSATAAPLSDGPLKKLQVLAGQTIIDSAVFGFPAVKAKTSFLVQWADQTNKVVGTTVVLVYPPDLLKELKALAGGEPLGIFDPAKQIKPLLQVLAIKFSDLEEDGVANYSGKLAIMGPFTTKEQMPEDLRPRIKAAAEKGAALVWLQPPRAEESRLLPSYYSVSQGKGTVIIAEARLVMNLKDDPQAQMNLLHLCRQAVHPEPLRL